MPPGARPVTASWPFASIPEGGSLVAAPRGSNGLVPAQKAPWESVAVMKLASRVGQAPEAEPMLVEGPCGTVLAAVGEQRDHQIAGRAVSAVMQKQLPQRLERAAQYKAELEGRPRKPRPADLSGEPRREGATQPLATRKPAMRTALATGSSSTLAEPGPAGPVAFGAVYEYKDRVGRPVYVGATAEMPENSWLQDYGSNAGVCNLAQQGGSASVVWAGVGQGVCGATEMAAARDAVASDRAARQRITELQGAKPYSRHSALM